MLQYEFTNRKLVLSNNNFNISFIDIDKIDLFISENNLPLIINEIKNLKNDTSINYYDDILYGNFVFSKYLIKQVSPIQFIYHNDYLYIFTTLTIVETITNLINNSISKYGLNIADNYDFLLIIINISIDDLHKQMLNLQIKIDKLEDELIKDVENRSFNHKLLQIHKKITKLRKLSEQTSTSIEMFIYKLTTNENTKYITFLKNKANRLDNTIRDLNEHCIQIKELYQNHLDVSLNDTMNLFTVISAVFLPLTLITSWYGMNFIIPEFKLQYGYYIPIILSIVTIVLLVLFIKKYRFIKKNK